MTELFLEVLDMSISAGWLVLAVLVLRLLLKRAPRWLHVLLWGLVGIRLVCPVRLESPLSLVPSIDPLSPALLYERVPALQSGSEAVNSAVSTVPSQSIGPVAEYAAAPAPSAASVFAFIWCLGIVLMLAYSLLSYLRLHRSVREAALLRDNIYQSRNAPSAFILGIFRPRIFLPCGMDQGAIEYVIAHERAHIRRRDHWWKPLGFLLLTLYWFSPAVWLAYVLLCRDIELACDEKVIKGKTSRFRADYSQALLQCSISRRSIAACPLAFGEVGVKQRVKNILNYKKPGFWILLTALVLSLAVAACFLTDPVRDSKAALYEDLMLSVKIQDGSSVREGEPRWNYFDIRTFRNVTLPGAVSVDFSISRIDEEAITISFDRELLLDGAATGEIRLSPGQTLELVTPTPGGSTWYEFSLIPQSTIFVNSSEGLLPQLESLPEDYSLAQAKLDGCVVIENGDVSAGKDIWWNFVQSVRDGKPASVRYATYFTILDPSRYEPSFYESIKDSFPELYIHDLVYDGSSFSVCWYEDGERIQREYACLMHYTGEAETQGALYDSYERYVLTQSDAVTWEDIQRGLYSSQFGHYVYHLGVYTNLIYPWEPDFGSLEAAKRGLEPHMTEYRIATLDANEITWTLDIQVYEYVDGLEALVSEWIDLSYVRITELEGELRFTNSDNQ